MLHSGRMAGRACLIVGGTSGIGLATAERFLQEGSKVVVTGLTAESSRAALTTLNDCGTAWSIVTDVSDPPSIDAAFQNALEHLGGRIDVLFHVAGMSGRQLGDGPLDMCSLDAWDAVLDVNARGTFLTNQAAVRQMIRQDPDEHGVRGCVLNTGSVLASSPSPEFFATIAYAASKGAVHAMTLAAAARYARDGIRFNLLSPGLIETPMSARAVKDPPIRTYLVVKQPMAKGPGHPADCAEAAVFLCAPAARFITGVELKVDGGWSITEGSAVP